MRGARRVLDVWYAGARQAARVVAYVSSTSRRLSSALSEIRIVTVIGYTRAAGPKKVCEIRIHGNVDMNKCEV